MEDPFKTFVTEMLDSKEWSSRVEGDGRVQLEQDLHKRLMDQIDQAVVENLPDDKIDGLNDLLDKAATSDEVQQYIAGSGVDVKRITLETMLRFRELYLGDGRE